MSSVIAALAFVFATVVLVQQQADAAPAGAPVAAAVAAPGVGEAVTAQVDFRQFICPTLLSIRAAFAGSPFFSFVSATIDPLIASFGCTPSPG